MEVTITKRRETEQFNPRICPDLAHRARVQAAVERRRLGLLVEDAISLYLKRIERTAKRSQQRSN